MLRPFPGVSQETRCEAGTGRVALYSACLVALVILVTALE
jgi:hypothetical protein